MPFVAPIRKPNAHTLPSAMRRLATAIVLTFEVVVATLVSAKEANVYANIATLITIRVRNTALKPSDWSTQPPIRGPRAGVKARAAEI
ncbi:potential amino acid sensor system component [Paenibacillus sp. NAIST15-1]|nr:potential amino acid sensor system component [Paenibacillus sp. NAIST15-1]